MSSVIRVVVHVYILIQCTQDGDQLLVITKTTAMHQICFNRVFISSGYGFVIHTVLHHIPSKAFEIHAVYRHCTIFVLCQNLM